MRTDAFKVICKNMQNNCDVPRALGRQCTRCSRFLDPTWYWRMCTECQEVHRQKAKTNRQKLSNDMNAIQPQSGAMNQRPQVSLGLPIDASAPLMKNFLTA